MTSSVIACSLDPVRFLCDGGWLEQENEVIGVALCNNPLLPEVHACWYYKFNAGPDGPCAVNIKDGSELAELSALLAAIRVISTNELPRAEIIFDREGALDRIRNRRTGRKGAITNIESWAVSRIIYQLLAFHLSVDPSRTVTFRHVSTIAAYKTGVKDDYPAHFSVGQATASTVPNSTPPELARCISHAKSSLPLNWFPFTCQHDMEAFEEQLRPLMWREVADYRLRGHRTKYYVTVSAVQRE